MVKSAEEFLNELGESLLSRDGGDGELAGILQAHILQATPAANCVADAKAALEKLAADRAKTSSGAEDEGNAS